MSFLLSVTLFMHTNVLVLPLFWKRESIQTNFSPFLFVLSKTAAMYNIAHTWCNYFPTLHNQSFKLFFLWLRDNDEQHSNVAEYFAVADLCCKQTFACCKTTVNPIFPVELQTWVILAYPTYLAMENAKFGKGINSENPAGRCCLRDSCQLRCVT